MIMRYLSYEMIFSEKMMNGYDEPDDEPNVLESVFALCFGACAV